MVMGSGFKSSEVRGASWVTLGPQFAMKPAVAATKPSLFVSGVATLI